ncbi:hypothetical protein ALC53_03567 [Atta colombica]|uniref:Uncharacterized protein n=1 Tax=Atta colombica TaxID=520822 RepID=A0A195BN23_9HYME|nr:hypothetical protein ALC53_03567 [Atta colombica]
MDSDCSKEDKMVAFQFLETKMTMHSMYNQAFFQSGLDDEAITRELESDDTYKSQYLTENYVKAITSLKNRFGRDDLETLGVTTDKCAAILYPLIESSLPEEVLWEWQRSGNKKK